MAQRSAVEALTTLRSQCLHLDDGFYLFLQPFLGDIIGGSFNYCWFFSATVLLLHSPLEKMRAAESPFPDNYRLPVFPADDAGWRAAIKAR
jgi:hypothetical protein